MRIVLLSTRTPHHHYFAQKINNAYGLAGIIYESRRLKVPYSTGPFFEKEQEEYEKKFFDPSSGGVNPVFPPSLQSRVIDVFSVNSPEAVEYLKEQNPDVVIVYGTGILKGDIFTVPRWGLVNLHGGIAQKYRGLDSMLWTMYHEDFENIGITIHYVEPELDTGPILSQELMTIEKGNEIFHFRYKTTVQVTRMCLDLFSRFKSEKCRIPAVPQEQKGEYYSAMSLDKKLIAHENLKRYQESL